MSDDVKELRKQLRLERKRNKALRAAAAYVLRVGAIDPTCPPDTIYDEVWNGPAVGLVDRKNAAESEWDAHMATLKGKR